MWEGVAAVIPLKEEMEPNVIMNFRDRTLKKTTLDISLDFHLGGRLRQSESQPKPCLLRRG